MIIFVFKLCPVNRILLIKYYWQNKVSLMLDKDGNNFN